VCPDSHRISNLDRAGSITHPVVWIYLRPAVANLSWDTAVVSWPEPDLQVGRCAL